MAQKLHGYEKKTDQHSRRCSNIDSVYSMQKKIRKEEGSIIVTPRTTSLKKGNVECISPPEDLGPKVATDLPLALKTKAKTAAVCTHLEAHPD